MGVSEWVRLFFFFSVVGCCCCCFSFCSELHQPGRRAKTALDRSLFFFPYSLSSEHFHGKGGSGSRTSPARQQTTHRGTVGEWKSTGSANRQSNAKHDWGRGGGGRQKGRRRGKMWRGRGEGGGKAGEGGRMLPGHSSRWCLKCSGGLFPLLSLLMSFLCSCVFYTACDGRRTPPSWPPDGSVLFSSGYSPLHANLIISIWLVKRTN